VLLHVLPVAFPFLAWVHEHREQIQARELAIFRVLDLEDPRAPITYEVNWQECEKVAHLLYLWQTDAWEAEWARHSQMRLTHGSS
jgi:hypothetical protein